MASGIAEHHEARRKQNIIDKQAHVLKTKWEQTQDNSDQLYNPPEPRVLSGMEEDDYSSSRMRKVGSPPGIGNHQAPIIDKMRRELVRNQQLVEYTAKINNRYSSINYAQQW